MGYSKVLVKLMATHLHHQSCIPWVWRQNNQHLHLRNQKLQQQLRLEIRPKGIIVISATSSPVDTSAQQQSAESLTPSVPKHLNILPQYGRLVNSYDDIIHTVRKGESIFRRVRSYFKSSPPLRSFPDHPPPKLHH